MKVYVLMFDYYDTEYPEDRFTEVSDVYKDRDAAYDAAVHLKVEGRPLFTKGETNTVKSIDIGSKVGRMYYIRKFLVSNKFEDLVVYTYIKEMEVIE